MYHNLSSQLPVDVWDVLSLVEVISKMGVGMGYIHKMDYYAAITRNLAKHR